MKKLFYGIVLLLFFTVSCDKKEIEVDKSQIIVESKKEASSIAYYYNNTEYIIELDNERNLIESDASATLKQLIDQNPNLSSFQFGANMDKVFMFNSEMEGYKYVEENIDKALGRKFQVGHATNLLRDHLISKYGADIDYSNTTIYSEAKKGVEEIYSNFKIAGAIPRNLEDFMGKLERNDVSKAGNRSNGSFRLWEHINSQGEMFDIESEPNVWIWTHGNYNCFKTYAAADLNWNYRDSNESWNDCMSSVCFLYQPGSDGTAYGFYRHPHFNQSNCAKYTIVFTAQDYGANGVVCVNNLANQNYVNIFCGNMENNLSSLRMQYVWQGCPFDFSDF